MYQVSGGAGGYSEGLKSERVSAGGRLESQARDVPTGPHHHLQWWLDSCLLSSAFAPSNAVWLIAWTGVSSGWRTEEEGPAFVRTQLKRFPFTWLQSHSSLVPPQLYPSHLDSDTWVFLDVWLHIYSLLVYSHTWLLFQERLEKFISWRQLSPIASSPPGCIVWCYIQAALSTAYIGGSGIIYLAPTLCCALYICYLTESSLRPFREGIITPFHRLENLGSEKRSKLPKIAELVIGEADSSNPSV